MTTRTWNGGTGDWYTATDWATDVAPVPGDTVDVAGGLIEMFGTEAQVSGIFDGQTVLIGGASVEAAIGSDGARFGNSFTIETPFAYTYAAFASVGSTGYAGIIDVNGGAFEILTETSSGQAGGDFVLNTDGQISIASAATLYLTGRLDESGGITVNPDATFVNSGSINVEQSRGGFFLVKSEGTLTGGGTLEIGLGGTVGIEGTVINQTIAFSGPGGIFAISEPISLSGTIQNFQTGDFIDLYEISETNASYNTSTDTLTAYTVQNGVTSDAISLHVTGPSGSSTLTASPDGLGGTLIEYANSPSPDQEGITGGEDALGAEIVQATMKTHSGAPITGAGIKIGIISDSFDNRGGANTDAAAGYLPANANGTSAVDVLEDEASGGTDEGRAMAELVHQVAPGAQIYFNTVNVGGGGENGLATAVNALVAVGVNIIVDDEAIPAAPFFQVTGSADTAIQNAINDGVSYFTAAGNYANSYYQGTFTDTPTTFLGLQVYAQTFTSGNPYVQLTVTSPATIALQWNAPFPTTTSGMSPVALQMELFTTAGSPVDPSVQSTSVNGSAYASEPESIINNVSPGTYDLAVYQTAGMPAVSQFKFIVFENGGGDSTIDDPAAENGSGAESGQALVPGVNTVAASAFSNSPAFTGDDQTEWFSSAGPGELLFNSTGTAYATPVSDGKPDFTAPDGIDVAPSLSGFQPFSGTSAAAPNAAAVAALMLQANPSLTPAEITADMETSALNLGLPTSQQGAGLVQAVGAVDLALACFATGTRLATKRGNTPVEALRLGDLLQTADGRLAPVVWIGQRHVNCARHPRPADVSPVRIRKGAFAAGLPHSDLLLSPDHAVFVDGVLIPIKHLMNGSTITQEQREQVTYWHVELERHDKILAEGLPCESYLDTGNRSAFANGGSIVQMHPDFALFVWETEGCARLVVSGPEVEATRRRLGARAAAMGSSAALCVPQLWEAPLRSACRTALMRPLMNKAHLW
jgi:hypothetical protein